MINKKWIVWCSRKKTNAFVSEGVGWSNTPICAECGRMIYDNKHPEPHHFCAHCGEYVKKTVVKINIKGNEVKAGDRYGK